MTQEYKALPMRAMWKALPFALAAAGVFLRPEAAMNGVQQGMDICVQVLIPTMFPFLVLSGLVLASPLATWAGLLLRPVTRLLGIRSKKAPAALLCGLLGGFAAGSRAVGQLLRQQDLSPDEAQCLLVAAVCSGPAFVVGSVGTGMLKSNAAGWLLYGCQIAAGLVCAWLFRPRANAAHKNPTLIDSSQRPPYHLVDAVQSGVQATALLCGYVVLFAYLAAIIAPANAPAEIQFLLLAPLEVTGACRAASTVAWSGRVYLCAGAISVMGASVFVQVRAFAGRDISLQALGLSRLVHLPLMLALVWCALKVVELPAEAAVPVGGWAPMVRMPADVLCAVFVLCALVFGAQIPRHLQWRKNRV